MSEREGSIRRGSLASWMRRYRTITTRIRNAGNDGELQKAWDQFWVLNADEPDYGSGSTSFLLPCLLTRNALTVLCVGNGASLEAHALVQAGFLVEVLDISAEANRILREASPLPERLERILGGHYARPGGRMVIHTGDFRAVSLCPGPFDVVIARRMLQYLPVEEIPSALHALQGRLTPNGLLVLESQNARSTRSAYVELLRSRGFAVCWDLQVQGQNVSAPRMLSTVGTQPAAWVMSTTG